VARQVRASDFDDFDLLVAMDRTHQRDLERLAPDPEAAAKVHLLREWDPQVNGDLDVPDPYYGGRDGFRDVFDLIDRSSTALLDEIERGG
jgi:protein-tyrosine phosphatase